MLDSWTHWLRWEPWATPLATASAGGRLHGVRLDPELLSGDPDRWVPALAARVLGPAERSTWEGLSSSPRRQRQWLLGRLAAKDVVCSLVRDLTGVRVDPADIEVTAGSGGAPAARFRTMPVPVDGIRLSIAHTGDTAVALATANGQVRGVGIDVERCRSRPRLERKGLTPLERARLAGLSTGKRDDLATRWWCAKEAAAKALGAGLDRLGGPQSIVVTPLNEDSGLLRVDTPAAPAGRSKCMRAASHRDGDLVVATVVDVGV